MDLPDASLKNTILSLQHGEFKEIGYSDETLRERLEASIFKGDYLDKRTFYKESEWPDSGTSSQTKGELKIIPNLAPQLANELKDWSSLILIEYGSGDGLKTEIILDELETRRICCSYIAIDINADTLSDYLERLKPRYKLVKCVGLCSTFEDATSEVKSMPGDKFIFSLASTLNLLPEEYVLFLQELVKSAKRIMISQQIPISKACVDSGYHTNSYESFIWRGLEHGNKLINRKEFNKGDWKIGCDITSTEEYWVHHFVVTPREHIKGKKPFETFASVKYTDKGFRMMAKRAGCKIAKSKKDDDTGMIAYQLEPS